MYCVFSWSEWNQVKSVGSLMETDSPTTFLDETEWQTLPDNVLLHILSFLDAKNVLQAAETCKQWYRVALDEFLWKSLFYRRWKVKRHVGITPGRKSWYQEYKRLWYHTPCVESEAIHKHNGQVLHVSFSHDGSMFATSSKDSYIKVWNTSYPVTLKFEANLKTLTWKYTQFSQFNETDTLLLVSGVHFGNNSSSGEIAVFSLKENFSLQARVINKPYDVFGAWYNESYLFSGNLHVSGPLQSCSALWLNKASQETESEHESVVMKLYAFVNKNASSIRTLLVAKCVDDTSKDASVVQESVLVPNHLQDNPNANMILDINSEEDKNDVIDLNDLRDWPLDVDADVQEEEMFMNKSSPDQMKTQLVKIFENGELKTKLIGLDGDERERGKLNGTIEYHKNYRDAEGELQELAETLKLDVAMGPDPRFYVGAERDVEENNVLSNETMPIAVETVLSSSYTETSSPAFFPPVSFNRSRSDLSLPCADGPLDLSVQTRRKYQRNAKNNRKNTRINMQPYSDLFKSPARVSPSPPQPSSPSSSSVSPLPPSSPPHYSSHRRPFVASNHSPRSSSACDSDLLPVSKGDDRIPSLSAGGQLQSSCSVENTYDSESQGFVSDISNSSESQCAYGEHTQQPCLCHQGLSLEGSVLGGPLQSNFFSGSQNRYARSNLQASSIAANSRRSGAQRDSNMEINGEREDKNRDSHKTCSKNDSQEKRSKCPDKYLIFSMGSLTYTPHQIGIKKICNLEKVEGPDFSRIQIIPPAEGPSQGTAGNEGGGFDVVDIVIDMHGHIIGMCLSPDHRFLYVNIRPWPKNYCIENPLYPPPIAQEIDIHVIDLSSMKEVGVMHRSHKAYTPNDDCFFIFMDVCKDYVASGAEDKHGYIWDRHYGMCLNKLPHDDIVNCVAFNPADTETLVTVSDDSSIKIWRSLHRQKDVIKNHKPASKHVCLPS